MTISPRIAPPITVVFFDAAGTLLSVRGGVGVQYAAMARRFGVEANPAALDAGFPAAFRAAPRMAFPGAPPGAVPALEKDVWRGLVRRLLTDAGLWPQFGEARFTDYFEALYAHFATAAAWAVYPDVEPTLRAVRERGCGIGLISNFDGRIVPLLEDLGLARWFDSLTLSSRVGAAKPDRHIFEHALRRHGVAADAALHVGDSATDDLDGARGAGLAAVLLDRGGRTATVPVDSRIGTLAELSRFLRRAGAGPAAGPASPPGRPERGG